MLITAYKRKFVGRYKRLAEKSKQPRGKEVNMNNNGKFEQLAHEFAEAIRVFAEKPDNIDNFESYLSYHFDVWMEKYASNPEGLVSEMKHFAEMEI